MPVCCWRESVSHHFCVEEFSCSKHSNSLTERQLCANVSAAYAGPGCRVLPGLAPARRRDLLQPRLTCRGTRGREVSLSCVSHLLMCCVCSCVCLWAHEVVNCCYFPSIAHVRIPCQRAEDRFSHLSLAEACRK